MKLSPKQKEVIRLMREGWELRQFYQFRNAYWLQATGCAGVGSSKEITDKTAMALLTRKMIQEAKCDERLRTYTLTDLGKTIEI